MQISGDPSPEEVRRAIISTLLAVSSYLPEQVKLAVQFANGCDDPKSNTDARVSLWQSIAGRDMESTPDVLFTRLGICALHPDSRPADAPDVLDYFVGTYRRSGLPEAQLAPVLALTSYYEA